MASFLEKYEAFKEKEGITQVPMRIEAMNVGKFVEKYRNGELVIKNYQRAYTYHEKKWRKASMVIQTILLKRIIPPVVLLEKDGKYEIIDGQQRILSIIKFLDNDFKLNLSGRYDDLSMLNTKFRRDLGNEIYREISLYNLNMLLIDEEVSIKDPYFPTKVFLDLNVDPIPVSKNDIILNFSYSPLVPYVKTLTKEVNNQPVKEVMWNLFAFGNFKQNGQFRKLAKDKQGAIDLRLFYHVLSFIDEEIKPKEIDWIKQVSLRAIDENTISDNKIDKFEEITKKIARIYQIENTSAKVNTPFFVLNERNKVEFLPELADIFYIAMKHNYSKFDNDFIQEHRLLIKDKFEEMKTLIVANKNHAKYFDLVNVQKENFKDFLNELL